MLGYAQRRDLFSRDAGPARDPAHRIGVRVITETACTTSLPATMFSGHALELEASSGFTI